MGERFGTRIIVEIIPPKYNVPAHHVICRCDCGREQLVRYSNLIAGNQASCNFCCGPRALRHGATQGGKPTPEFEAWTSMRKRCLNPKHPAYHNYGGRGITICPEWEVYECFLRDMGLRPSSKYTLDRADNEKGYSRDNCRWVTMSVQSTNRRNNRRLNYQGRTQTLCEWSREIGINHQTLAARIDRGWTTEEVLTQPRRQGSKIRR